MFTSFAPNDYSPKPLTDVKDRNVRISSRIISIYSASTISMTNLMSLDFRHCIDLFIFAPSKNLQRCLLFPLIFVSFIRYGYVKIGYARKNYLNKEHLI